MKRFQAQNLKTVRRKVQTGASNAATATIEPDETTLNKLLKAESYTKEDIIKCAELLFPKYGHDFNQQFKLVEKIEDLDSVFVNKDVQPGKPLFVIFAKEENQWVFFCVVKSNEKNYVLYKDPCGALVSMRVSTPIEKIGNVIFIAQSKQDQDAEDESSYGPLTVRNLKIALDAYQKDPNNFVRKFREIEFAHLNDIRKNKNSEIIKLTSELAENVEFKNSFKRFIDDLPLDLSSEMAEYKKVLQEEKHKEDTDLDRIAEAKAKYARKVEEFQEKMKHFEENYKSYVRNTESGEYELEIQKKFPDEMKKVASIFTFLDTLKIDEQFYEVLRNLCDILDIEYKKMFILYKLKSKKNETIEQERVDLDVESIDKIAENLPAEKVYSGDDSTLLDQLLREVTIGMDGSETSSEEIRHLEEKFNLVQQKYEKWKNEEIKSINTWAKQHRGILENSDDVICEAIAIMDRAFNLLTTYRLRRPQILSALIFLDNRNNQGRLCQIQTGEGKTLIIGLLAVIRVLQGQKVDVITSNEVLANDGVTENKLLFSTFNITVASNNKSESKVCYKADVLYGTISNFQFDYLREIVDGIDIRKGREFGLVVLDEVDSMLVDNGGHIAKLATPYPGMEILKYIYINIWQELYKAEENLAGELQNRIEELIDTNSNAEIKTYLEETVGSVKKIIKEKIKASNFAQVPLIPRHLKGYIKRKVDIWIRNALYAKYSCHEHQQYRIIKDDDGEDIITPVDYLNTGVTMRNTIWSNGLHQFVQLKHNLRLSFESMTSSFISNIGYIKKYEDKNIFGMTGTLGSRAEQELLSNIYQVTYAKMPTYKPKKFQEVPGVVVDNDKWASFLTLQVLEKIDEGRAVLVICETEQDLLEIKANLELFKHENVRIRTYANEDNARETKERVKIGDAVLATNIAGRGTNFKTEKALEKNGGLHVFVGFLPYNLRVEGQAFGRTARQGNKGTAQLIIRRDEVDELKIPEENPVFTKIKTDRDRLEQERLKQIDEVLVKEIDFKDEVFNYFADFQRKWRREHDDREYTFVLQDLREFWAFWLDGKDFKASNIKKTAKEEFDGFLVEAHTIISGEINHNPFYCVTLAEHYLDNDEINKAFAALERAILLNGHKMMVGAHMKFFEALIIDGKAIWDKLKKYLIGLFTFRIETGKPYKDKAIKQLSYAKDAIKTEIEYLGTILSSGNSDFQRILIPTKTNFFLNHISSRYFLLQIHEGNIDELLRNVQTLSGVSLGGKTQTTVDTFEEIRQMEQPLTAFDLNELHLIGIDAFYFLREVADVPEYVVRTAQGQIIGGIATIAIGIAFPPVLPIMSPIGITLISEGIMDIVITILTLNSEVDLKEFLKDKFVSYAVDILSFGIGSIARCIKIVSLALKFCRKLSFSLRKSIYLKTLCQKLATKVDDFGHVLERTIATVKFNRLNKFDQIKELTRLKEAGDLVKFRHLGGIKKLKELQSLKKISRYQLLGVVCKKTVAKFQRKITEKLVGIMVVKLLDAAFEKLRQVLKESLKASIKNNSVLCEKIRTTPINQITEETDNFLRTDDVRDVTEKIASELLKALKNTYIDVVVYIYSLSNNIYKFVDVQKHFEDHLDNHIHGGDANNDLDKTLETICSVVVDSLLSLIYDSLKKSFTLAKNSFARHIKIEPSSPNEGTEDPSSPTETENTEALVVFQAKPSMRKYYEILDLPLNATASDARRQYRKMLLRANPDGNFGDPQVDDKYFDAYTRIRRYQSGSEEEETSTLIVGKMN